MREESRAQWHRAVITLQRAQKSAWVGCCGRSPQSRDGDGGRFILMRDRSFSYSACSRFYAKNAVGGERWYAIVTCSHAAPFIGGSAQATLRLRDR